MTATSEAPQANSRSPASTSSTSVEQTRRKHPCVLCQQRKVKCDRNDPCANCVKAHVQCVSSTMLPPKRRKKRFPEAELLARLRRYEERLKSYGVDIDAINNETWPIPKASLKVQPRDGGSHSVGEHASRPYSYSYLPSRPDGTRSLAIRRSLKHVKNNLYQGVTEEFLEAEDILQGSSDDERLQTPIIQTYEAINPDGSEFLFPMSSSDSVTDLHPSSVHIFRLWQSFIDNINPIIKIFHAPTVQQQILEASADLENIPKGMEALMFGIYATAVMSLAEAECMTIFREEKSVLLSRYRNGAQLALARAGLLRSSDMIILQAFVLYLISCLNFSIDPRSHFCLCGIAIRIAQRMGLNYDGTTYGLSPYEIEMRRRLWYQIVFLDKRVSEISGVGCTVLSYTWTTKVPLNVNDSDLFPDMKEPPMESKGLTEMVYVIQRCEIANVMQEYRGESCNGDTLDDKDLVIDELKCHLEDKYNQFCDPSVPLHLLASLMFRSAVAKLKMGPRHPHTFPSTLSIPSPEEDKLFLTSVTMIESHNNMLASPSLKRFMWHIWNNFPFPAHIYLLCVLKQRTKGILIDRAWKALEEHYKNYRMASEVNSMPKHRDTALQFAMANITMKAWNARERDNPGIEIPRFVTHLRCRLLGGRNGCPKAGFSSSAPKSVSALAVPVSVVGKVSMVKTDTTVPEATISFSPQPVDPFQWLNNQPGQFDMGGMGMGFDSEMMQGLIPGGDTTGLGWDIWSDYQPDINVTGAPMGVGIGFDAQGGANDHKYRGSFS